MKKRTLKCLMHDRTVFTRISCLIIKLSCRNDSLFLLQKKSRFEYASYAHSNKDFNFDRLFLSNHSPTVFALEIRILRLEVRSHRPHRARSDTYFAKLKRSYFWFAPPLYPRDRTASNNSHHWAWRAGLSRGLPGRMLTGQIEPCIIC